MSQSVAVSSLQLLPSYKQGLTTFIMRLAQDSEHWLHNREHQKWVDRSTEKCIGRRKGGRRGKRVHPGHALGRKHTPSGPEGQEHFHSLLLRNPFLICVRAQKPHWREHLCFIESAIPGNTNSPLQNLLASKISNWESHWEDDNRGWFIQMYWLTADSWTTDQCGLD